MKHKYFISHVLIRILQLCLLIGGLCHAQIAVSQEVGSPYLQNYTPKMYEADKQNWAILKDSRGVMYFGNNNGLLEYDGSTWEKIDIDIQTIIRSLAMSPEGVLYVGAQNSFGYMVVDTFGRYNYQPISTLLPDEERNFKDIWQTHYTEEGVYFRANKMLFRYNPKEKTLNKWYADSKFHTSFYVNGQYYLRVREKELLYMKGDSLHTVPNSLETFEGEHIYSILPYENGKLLVSTQTKGLYEFDPKTYAFRQITVQDADFFKKSIIYGATALQNQYVFHTIQNGIIWIDSRGNTLHKINETYGLNNNRVFSAYTVDNQDVWLALNNGISKVELHSPMTFFDDKLGLKGFVRGVVRHEGKIYAVTSTGAYVLEKGRFRQIMESGDGWTIFSCKVGKESKLLIGDITGIYEWTEKSGIKKIKDATQVYDMIQSKQDSNTIFFGEKNGLGKLTYQNGKWKYEFPVSGIEDEIRQLKEDKYGNLWLKTKYNGVYQLSKKYDTDTLMVQHLDTLSGLPSMSNISILKESDDLLVSMPEGIFSFDDERHQFVRNKNFTFLSDIADNEQVITLKRDAKDNFWVITNNESESKVKYIHQDYDTTYSEELAPFKRFAKDIQVYDFYMEADGVIWLGTTQGLYRYDQRIARNYGLPFHALIRKVVCRHEKLDMDTTLFHGTFFQQAKFGLELTRVPSLTQPEIMIPNLENGYNSFIFQFATPFFEEKHTILFRYELVGYDRHWSKWTNERKKEYTNLPTGDYTFRVQAKNIYGKESTISEYHFVILPPWYQTVWAYMLFVALAVGFVVGVAYVAVWYNTRKLKQQKAELEREVKIRTETILQKTVELEQKNEELAQQAEELKIQRDQLRAHELQLMTSERELKQTNKLILAQQEELSDTNEELIRRNKAIMDSINYARRIQAAMLPEAQDVTNYLPESFIYFRPKDVVSGDFFWFSERRGKYVITAADCTGHGVPGALMSIIGMNLLYQTVTVKGITTSSHILDKLHSGVKNILRQNQTQNQDGMDIALCVIDPKNQFIEYSGARNPLVYIQNNKMKVIKGNRQPIGGLQYAGVGLKDEKFDRHVIKLQDAPETTCYLFSDGFQDQFGHNGQKFLSKRFRKKLHDNVHLPMKDQYHELREMFVKWKGAIKQTDDVLVIGFRVYRDDGFEPQD